jgi:IclR family acetate operon transcriptional repressor
MNARLSCSATGNAWMLTMSEEWALELISRQGFGAAKDFGPNAPTPIKQILNILHAGRDRGYAVISEVFAPGMTAMAAPVQKRGYPAIGVISIARPLVRLDEKQMHALGPALLAAATKLVRRVANRRSSTNRF